VPVRCILHHLSDSKTVFYDDSKKPPALARPVYAGRTGTGGRLNVSGF
jgi:hypothetical protein